MNGFLDDKKNATIFIEIYFFSLFLHSKYIVIVKYIENIIPYISILFINVGTQYACMYCVSNPCDAMGKYSETHFALIYISS